MSLLDLPCEVICKISEYLDPFTVLRLSHTTRTLFYFLSESTFIWEGHVKDYNRHFNCLYGPLSVIQDYKWFYFVILQRNKDLLNCCWVGADAVGLFQNLGIKVVVDLQVICGLPSGLLDKTVQFLKIVTINHPHCHDLDMDMLSEESNSKLFRNHCQRFLNIQNGNLLSVTEFLEENPWPFKKIGPLNSFMCPAIKSGIFFDEKNSQWVAVESTSRSILVSALIAEDQPVTEVYLHKTLDLREIIRELVRYHYHNLDALMDTFTYNEGENTEESKNLEALFKELNLDSSTFGLSADYTYVAAYACLRHHIYVRSLFVVSDENTFTIVTMAKMFIWAFGDPGPGQHEMRPFCEHFKRVEGAYVDVVNVMDKSFCDGRTDRTMHSFNGMHSYNGIQDNA